MKTRPSAAATSEVLDVRTMAFAPGPSMGSAREDFAVVLIDPQHVLIIGGMDSQDESGTPLATTEVLDSDVATMEFAPGPTMPSSRRGCTVIRLDVAGGRPRVLVIGRHGDGYATRTTLLLSVEDERRA